MVVMAEGQAVNKVNCVDIHSVVGLNSCPDVDRFINGMHLTCMYFNSAAAAREKDKGESGRPSSNYRDFEKSRTKLRTQYFISLNEFWNLKKTEACRESIDRGHLSKALEVMRQSAELLEVGFSFTDGTNVVRSKEEIAK